ncbi:MAG: hemolysin III family protein [Myxococcales bacterium]|nr:hemolysin III family protein [Myxococcales bacterium]
MTPRRDPEEAANTLSHGLGLCAALIATPFVLSAVAERGNSRSLVGAAVFSVTMVLLYLASTLYHGAKDPALKRRLRVLDHAAIFLLIAGTYTPFTLGVLRGAWGYTLFGVVWALAALGVGLKLLGGLRFPRLSMVLYLSMGWVVVFAIHPLWRAMQPWGLFWLVAGGVAYTSGVAFYAAERLRHNHLVWHLFVIAGTACHAVAVSGYAG